MTDYLSYARLVELTSMLQNRVRAVHAVKDKLAHEPVVLRVRVPSPQTKRLKRKLQQLFVYRYSYLIVEGIPLGRGRYLMFNGNEAVIIVERESWRHFGLHLKRSVKDFVYYDLTGLNRDPANVAVKAIQDFEVALRRLQEAASSTDEATRHVRVTV